MSARLERLREIAAWIDDEIAAARVAEIRTMSGDPHVLAVCDLYGVSVESIILGMRSHDVTRARHAASWLLHRRGWSIADLASTLGYNKSTVAASLRRVENDAGMRALLIGIEAAA